MIRGEKILFVGPEFRKSRGGIGMCLKNYSQYISPFKIIVTSRFQSLLMTVLFFPFCLMGIMVKLLTDREIEIVHIHGASLGSFYRKYLIFLIVKYCFRKKVIYHIHGGGYKEFFENSSPRIQKAIRFMIGKVDLLICLSEKWKQFFGSTFEIRKIAVVNNVVLPLSNPKALKESKRLELLFLGLIGDNKGIFDLLKVIKNHRIRFQNRLFLRVGGNGEVERLKKTIKEYCLESLVSFEGWVGKERKDQLFRTSNAYILPSYLEGQPLSILEAMNYGLPIISTRVGGIPDILNTYENGLLVEPGDHEGLALALNLFMKNSKLLQNYSRRSREGIVDFYPDKVFKDLAVLYDQLLRAGDLESRVTTTTRKKSLFN
jgi:glycosyltransferase involved in cell wall biosynthesis